MPNAVENLSPTMSWRRSESPSSLMLGGMRQMPASPEAEEALLGALLAQNRAYQQVQSFLRPHHFNDPVNAKVYERIMLRIESGMVADVVTLRSEFENTGILDQVGGAQYLVHLLSAMVGIINAGAYGQQIHDCYLRRELISRCDEAANVAYGADMGVAAEEQIERLHDALTALDRERASPENIVSIGDAAAEAVAAGERAYASGGVIGLTTGFAAMDAKIGGLEAATLNVLAARPGMGKTGLAVQMGLRQARPKIDDATGEVIREGAKVGIISLEMGAHQIGRRALSLASTVALRDLRRGTFVGDETMAEKVVRGQQQLRQLSVLIEDEPNLSVAAIRQRARAMRRKMKGLSILYIDHLQLVGRGEIASKHGDAHALSEVTYGLKQLSKEEGIPVVLLAQLNRNLESRDEKRPQLSDLRGSGSIEQDADTVTFLYRPEYYLGDQPPEQTNGETREKYANRVAEWEGKRRDAAGKAEAIHAKVRDDEANVTSMLRFDGRRVRFSDPVDDAHAVWSNGDNV